VLAELEAVELGVGLAAHDRVQAGAGELVGDRDDRDLDDLRVLLDGLLDDLRADAHATDLDVEVGAALEREGPIVVAADDVATVEWTMRGTFSGGSFQGIRATGKPIEIEGVDVVEVREGLQYRNSIYYDGASFARQIGMLPPLGSLGDRTLLALFNARSRIRRPAR